MVSCIKGAISPDLSIWLAAVRKGVFQLPTAMLQEPPSHQQEYGNAKKTETLPVHITTPHLGKEEPTPPYLLPTPGSKEQGLPTLSQKDCPRARKPTCGQTHCSAGGRPLSRPITVPLCSSGLTAFQKYSVSESPSPVKTLFPTPPDRNNR